jgi:hypothetical protein
VKSAGEEFRLQRSKTIRFLVSLNYSAVGHMVEACGGIGQKSPCEAGTSTEKSNQVLLLRESPNFEVGEDVDIM